MSKNGGLTPGKSAERLPGEGASGVDLMSEFDGTSDGPNAKGVSGPGGKGSSGTASSSKPS